MRESLGEYARAVAKWWWIVTVGFVLAIVSVIQAVTGRAGGPVWLWAILAFAGLAIAQFMAFHESRKELVGLKTQIDELKAQPELDIVFRDEGSFRQVQRVRDANGIYTETLFRVGIEHGGLATVERVVVELKRIDQPVLLGVPLALHVLNDNPLPGGAYRSEFPLDAGHTQFVDVVFKRDYDGQSPSNEMFIYHAVFGVSQLVPARRYEIVLYAHGEDVAHKEKRFIIDLDAQGTLQFQAVTSSS